MVSADKLIKVGVKYSDQYFNDLKRIYSNAYRDNDSLEEFLNSTKDYSIGNPLDAGGFNETLTNLIVSSTNDVRFSRPAQKALMQTIIRNTTGELIVDVGDDVKNGVRDIVNRGYRNGKLSHTRVASEIESTLDGINNKRARCIARTEIKRAQTTSNYVVARERGANAYRYKCGAEPCDICSVDCGKVFPIDDTEHLPPRHPNCCCGVVFFKDPNLPPVENKPMIDNKVKTTTSKQATKTEKLPISGRTFEDIFKKKPKVYEESYEHIDANWVSRKHKLTTYDYGDIKLSFEDGAKLTHNELVEHLSSLPAKFGETQAERITIYNTRVKNVGGVWKPDTKECAVYFNNSKLDSIDTLTHEMSHTLDVLSKTKKGSLNKYSDPKIYEKIFKADNKLYEYKGPTGRTRKPKKFPTEYAGKSYTKFKRQKLPDRLYVEDFADSSKLYLNPSTHKNFVKEFPNRAEYLESIYGKPVFKKDSLISREIANENKIIDAQQKQKNLKVLKTEKFNSLTRKELDIELEKVLGNKDRVKAYHTMKKEVEKLDSVSDAIMMNDKRVLINAGWGESTAQKILANPNAYLPKVREKKSKLKQVIEEVDNLVKDNLNLTKTSESISKPKTNPKTSTVKEPVEKAKTTKKETSSKKPTSSKKDNVDPVKRGIPKEVSQDTYYDHESFKTIKYEDGTTIKFKKSGNPEYPQQTLDEVTINGKTYKYKDNDVYDHFKYQDAQLTKEELDFADEFIEKYGTYAGQEFNSLQRGKLSKKDLEDIADDEAFKWLNENFERYNKILDKSTIEHDVVSMRIQAKNYVPKGATTIQDKAYTSSSVGISRTNLIDCFGNSRNIDDNWTYLTVTPKGTTGARFQGNSIARKYGSLDDDFERELTYKPNMKFDILLLDEKNKIMILQPH